MLIKLLNQTSFKIREKEEVEEFAYLNKEKRIKDDDYIDNLKIILNNDEEEEEEDEDKEIKDFIVNDNNKEEDNDKDDNNEDNEKEEEEDEDNEKIEDYISDNNVGLRLDIQQSDLEIGILVDNNNKQQPEEDSEEGFEEESEEGSKEISEESLEDSSKEDQEKSIVGESLRVSKKNLDFNLDFKLKDNVEQVLMITLKEVKITRLDLFYKDRKKFKVYLA
ncbi:hypothetical protein B7463_g10036, partial [Scytalidium lignicola]